MEKNENNNLYVFISKLSEVQVSKRLFNSLTYGERRGLLPSVSEFISNGYAANTLEQKLPCMGAKTMHELISLCKKYATDLKQENSNLPDSISQMILYQFIERYAPDKGSTKKRLVNVLAYSLKDENFKIKTVSDYLSLGSHDRVMQFSKLRDMGKNSIKLLEETITRGVSLNNLPSEQLKKLIQTKNELIEEIESRFPGCFSPLINKYKSSSDLNDLNQFMVIGEKLLTKEDADYCFRYFKGETLESIASSIKPKVTRERIRQILARYKKYTTDATEWEYVKNEVFSLVKDNKLPDNKVLLKINKRALNALKRKLNAAQEFSSSSRIKLAKILNLDAEFEELNSSVWNEKKAIKQLKDFAIFLGKPNLMPMQKEMREHKREDLRGVIGRFGGQSLMAKKADLIYQGQTVSEDGTRTFWTDEKIKSFLNEVAEKVGRPKKMPKQNECRAYAPNPSSIINIITRSYSKIKKSRTWDQVASDYGFEGNHLVEEKVSASDLLKQAYLETRKK